MRPGSTHTPEARAAISKRIAGRSRSPAAKKAISASMKAYWAKKKEAKNGTLTSD